ncbi:hypothetical protein HMPREF0352_2091 [Enterococcus faecium TX1330]|nr:hypothetical protein HMPREF0352_2091 [Enterococcus faecium TX1330]EEV58247.1 predicted protein [Enterococcus faecium Com12]EGP5446384.1 hypothetical protein [Enterococcus faecium]MBQ0861510.1 hypothetical protein [Enterococcus lactis]EME8151314.1 hypothetical protein [Enterococcus faecium]
MINMSYYNGGINMSEIQVQSQQELAPKDPRGGVIVELVVMVACAGFSVNLVKLQKTRKGLACVVSPF